MTTALTRISSNEEYFNQKIMTSARLSQYWRAVSSRPSFKSASMNIPNIPDTFKALLILFFALTTIGSLIGGLAYGIEKRSMPNDFKPDSMGIFIASILSVYFFFFVVFFYVACIGKRRLTAFNLYIEQELLLKSKNKINNDEF